MDVTDLAPSAASVTYNSGSGTLNIFEGLTLVSTLDLPVGLTGHFSTATDGNGGTLVNLGGTLDNVECFAAGTRLLTPHGERAVETLKPGDEVVTRAGRSSGSVIDTSIASGTPIRDLYHRCASGREH